MQARDGDVGRFRELGGGKGRDASGAGAVGVKGKGQGGTAVERAGGGNLVTNSGDSNFELLELKLTGGKGSDRVLDSKLLLSKFSATTARNRLLVLDPFCLDNDRSRWSSREPSFQYVVAPAPNWFHYHLYFHQCHESLQKSTQIEKLGAHCRDSKNIMSMGVGRGCVRWKAAATSAMVSCMVDQNSEGKDEGDGEEGEDYSNYYEL
ncbi:hypothetical protein NE237_021340 [Protea cynaroides]|uniref:Uncharacterized protein n=1 Tax=Protea cynaroides TaxID=273540 RepID=A0A9Q0K497_9MAGN|nr:hypothetical protein NE237_021340 [Protea cynaroides]